MARYRYGNHTPANFTPRVQDDTGLSTVELANPPAVRAQILNPAAYGASVQSVNDHGNHHSIRTNPYTAANMQTWIDSRANLLANNVWTNPDILNYTNDVNAARTGQVN